MVLASSPSWPPPPDHSLLFNHFSLRPSESWPASHSLVPLLQQSPPQSTECRSTARDKSPEMEFCAQFNYIIILYEPNDIAPYNMNPSSCVSIQSSHLCSVTLFIDHHFGMAHRIFFVIRSYHHCHIANIVLTAYYDIILYLPICHLFRYHCLSMGGFIRMVSCKSIKNYIIIT